MRCLFAVIIEKKLRKQWMNAFQNNWAIDITAVYHIVLTFKYTFENQMSCENGSEGYKGGAHCQRKSAQSKCADFPWEIFCFFIKHFAFHMENLNLNKKKISNFALQTFAIWRGKKNKRNSRYRNLWMYFTSTWHQNVSPVWQMKCGKHLKIQMQHKNSCDFFLLIRFFRTRSSCPSLARHFHAWGWHGFYFYLCGWIFMKGLNFHFAQSSFW